MAYPRRSPLKRSPLKRSPLKRPSRRRRTIGAGRSVVAGSLLMISVGAAALEPTAEVRAPWQAPTNAGSEPGAIMRLRQMSNALNRYDYEGTLVYLHGDHLAALRIAHRVDDGASHESLLALNGPIRAVARTERGVTCVLPDSHPILVERKGVRRQLLRTIDGALGRIERHYLVHPLGSSRVAGRESDVIGIIPRDRLRYGYRFYLDRDTALPLKVDLMDGTGRPIEQVMFTDLSVLREPASVGDIESGDAGVEPVLPPSDWRLRQIPAGFDLIMYDATGGHDPAAPMQHLLLSDGLASVSVYIEAGDVGGLDGPARMGAVHAVGGRREGHQITVVGEVPAETVEAVLFGVRPATGP